MKMTGALSWILMFCVLAHHLECKKVVFIPMPYSSHTLYQANVARAVAKLGHEVWLTMPVFLANKTGVFDLSDLRVIPFETPSHLEEEAMKIFSEPYFEGRAENFDAFLRQTRENADVLLRNLTMLDTIRAIDSDLIVLDNMPMMYMLTIIPYRLGKPFAFLGSGYDPNTFRIPFSPASTPIPLLPYSDKMTFLQRLITASLWLRYLDCIPSAPADAVAIYAPEMPYVPLTSLVARAEVFLVEMDPVLDYPRPSVPNVKFVGGTAIKPAQPLVGEFRTFMDAATEGVVIASFGSYVYSLPPPIADKLLRALDKLPFRAILRANATSPNPAKIMTAAWIPQNDLLAHPNTKVFLSHCGNSGQYEALYHAVPVVGAPIFADQPYNAERMRVKGFAETVDLRTVSALELEATVLKVATDPRYKQAVAAASRLFRHLHKMPVDEAAYWLDHVMQYGGGYMRAASQEMPLYQHLLLDVLAVYAAVVLTAASLAVFSICRCCKRVFRKKTKAD